MIRNLLFVAVTLILLTVTACSSLKNPKTGKSYKTDEGVEITFYDRGEGPTAQNGDKLEMHYVGRLENDSMFGSSYKRNQPLSFELGNEEVIRGWEVGARYMKEGDSVLMVIPPEMAYGDTRRGQIPANSTLYFTVKLENLWVTPKPFDISKAGKTTLEDGLEIYTVKKGKGPALQDGHFVTVHYTGYLENGEVFDSSVERDAPIDIQLGKNQVIQGWEKALKNMTVGEKARIVIPPELAYGPQGRGQIPPNATLTFDVEIVDAKMPRTTEPFNVEGKDTLFTPSGLGIIKLNQTDQPKAAPGNVVTVHYTGYLEDGEVFDSSIEADQPISFPLGQGQVIPGWDEGLQHMRMGERARLIIPYQLGYGENGAGPIPPKAKLIFDVELMDIK